MRILQENERYAIILADRTLVPKGGSCVEVEPYLDLFLELGRSMVEAGAEIYRVEDTIIRLCGAYEMRDVEVFAIRSLIVVSVKDGQGLPER